MIASDVVRACSPRPRRRCCCSRAPPRCGCSRCSAFVYGTAAARVHARADGPDPADGRRPTRLQEANALLALTRSIASVAGPAIAGVLVVAAGSGEAIAVDAATFAFSALCLAALRAERRPGRRRRHRGARALPRRAARGLARGALARVAALGPDRDERLPRVRPAGRLRARPGARRARARRRLELGRRSSPASGSAASWATWWRCASRCAARCFIAALALVGASTQAAIIGSGLGTVGIAALELLAGICVALFFTLWDLSIQEQIPRHAVSRVSAYDFGVSIGLMPLGMAVCGPIADAVGLQDDAARDERRRAGRRRSRWLAQPSTSAALRRPRTRPRPAAARARALRVRPGSPAPRRGRRRGRARARPPKRPGRPRRGLRRRRARYSAHRPVDALAASARPPATSGTPPVAASRTSRVASTLPGRRDRRDPAGEVDRPPVPVARAAERRAGGHPDAQLREVVALGRGGVDEVERELEQPRASGHTSMAASPIVLTRRTSPRRRSAVSSTRRWATRPSSSGATCSPRRVKPTRSAKHDRDVARAGQRAGLALGGVDGLGAHRLAQVQAGHVLEHRADHRHEAGDALGVAARQLGLAEARLEHELERRASAAPRPSAPSRARSRARP